MLLESAALTNLVAASTDGNRLMEEKAIELIYASMRAETAVVLLPSM